MPVQITPVHCTTEHETSETASSMASSASNYSTEQHQSYEVADASTGASGGRKRRFYDFIIDPLENAYTNYFGGDANNKTASKDEHYSREFSLALNS